MSTIYFRCEISAMLTSQSPIATFGKTPPPVNIPTPNGDLDEPSGLGDNVTSTQATPLFPRFF